MLPDDVIKNVVDLCNSWYDIYQLHLTNKQPHAAVGSHRTSLPWMIEHDNKSCKLPKFMATTIQVLDLSKEALDQLFSVLNIYKGVTTIDTTRLLWLSFKKAKLLIQKINDSGLKLDIRLLPSQFEFVNVAKKRNKKQPIELIVWTPLLLPPPQQQQQQQHEESKGSNSVLESLNTGIQSQIQQVSDAGNNK